MKLKLKMTVGENLNRPVSFFCVIYDGLSAALHRLTQPNHSAFSWLCPAFCSSLIQTHSISCSSLISPRAAEAWVGKEESGPASQKNVPFSCLPAADRQLRGRRSPENYEGYFRRSNLRNTWDVNRTHSEESNTLSRSKEINNLKRWDGGGTQTPIRAPNVINTRPLLVPPGPGQCSRPAPGLVGSPVQGSGRRPENTHSQKLIWKPQAFIQMSGQSRKRETGFSSAFLTPSVSRTHEVWTDLSGSGTLLNIFIRFFTDLKARPFKRFRIISFPLKIRVASISSAILWCFGYC